MRVSILGCGWLGLPLGAHLVKRGHFVKGSTTSEDRIPEIREAGIEAFVLSLNPSLKGERVTEFFDTDAVVMAIPPGRRRADVESFHPRQVASVVKELEASPAGFVVFVSSTSVYPSVGGVVREEDAGEAPTGSGRALLVAERMLRQAHGFDTTIVRFGGLLGGDRIPARFLAGKRDVKDPDAPVNLVHREDCVEILTRILEGNIRGEVFNACCDDHPTRREYYTREARKFGLEPPTFSDEPTGPSKTVSSEKLKRALGYRFKRGL
jgi:nucleoside-diphosphate-sugar epimerase